jgi:NDP-sugar pyrophosphorylase family protein
MLPVAILAGGLATRLRPITERIPKSLVEVAGEPFLAHQLRLLVRQGIRDVVICAGYLGEMIQDFAGDGKSFGLRIRYSFDGPVLLGTAGALKRALPLLGEQFFTIYGDSYLPENYPAVGRFFLESAQAGLMTVYRNEGQWDTSNVEFHGGRIQRYDKKSRRPEMQYIDYGLGAFRASAFDQVPGDEPLDLATLYQRLLADGQLAGYEVRERFYEVGSFAGLEELSNLLSQHPPVP